MDSGQQWSPPKELMLPTPRPIKKVKWFAAARYLGNFGANFLFFGFVGVPIFGLVLFALSRAPGATIWTKWQRLVGPSPSDAVSGLLLFLFAYMGLFLWWVYYYFLCRKVEWLLKWGKPARAVVTDARCHTGDPRSGRGWEAKVKYQDHAGNLVNGKVRRELSEGQVLTVLYDPDKPSKIIDYPVAGYEIGGLISSAPVASRSPAAAATPGPGSGMDRSLDRGGATSADFGPPWSPPQELTLPTPRPVRMVSLLAAAGLSRKEFLFVAMVVLILTYCGYYLFFSDDWIKTLIGLAGLVATIVWLLVRFSATSRKANRLLRWGKPARAVVVHVGWVAGTRWPLGPARTGGHYASVIVYHDEVGGVETSEERQKLVKDQVLTVLYDPDERRRHIIYPVAGYEIGEPVIS